MNKSYKAARTFSPEASTPCRPIDLLHRLARTRLPMRIVDRGEIEVLRILKLGGSIKAAIPDVVRTLDGHGQSPAVVAEVTALGRFMLERFASRRPAEHLQTTLP